MEGEDQMNRAARLAARGEEYLMKMGASWK